MKTYRHDPVHTRQAYRAIAARFPLDPNKLPRGLTVLFNRLSQMDPAHLAAGHGRFQAAERDLLCRFYHRAPDANVVLAILLILAAARDPRAAQVARYFSFQDPPSDVLARLRRVWAPHRVGDGLDDQVPWLGKFLDRRDYPALHDHLWDEVNQGGLSLPEVVEAGDTPMLRRLTDRIVETADPLIARLPADWLNARALSYLEPDREDMLRAFLEAFPDQQWSTAFPAALRKAKGPPDPDQSPFYQSLAPGRLWRIRQLLFAPILDDQSLAPERRKFWEQWLHHVRDVQPFDGRWRLKIGRVWIEESEQETRFYRPEAEAPFDVIHFEGGWHQAMTQTVQELIG